MTVALMHYPRMGELPDAVFWEEEEEDKLHTKVFESPSTEHALDLLLQKPANTPWLAMFQMLAARNPDPGVWRCVETDSPASLLVYLRTVTLRTKPPAA